MKIINITKVSELAALVDLSVRGTEEVLWSNRYQSCNVMTINGEVCHVIVTNDDDYSKLPSTEELQLKANIMDAMRKINARKQSAHKGFDLFLFVRNMFTFA